MPNLQNINETYCYELEPKPLEFIQVRFNSKWELSNLHLIGELCKKHSHSIYQKHTSTTFTKPYYNIGVIHACQELKLNNPLGRDTFSLIIWHENTIYAKYEINYDDYIIFEGLNTKVVSEIDFELKYHVMRF